MGQSNQFFQGELDNIITQVSSSGDASVVQIASSETNIIAALPNDGLVNALVTIPYAHHEIHSGKFFEASVYEADVDAASTLSLMITTTTATSIHLVGLVKSSLGGSFVWSEAPNASGGSAVVAYNHNRQSANTATPTVVYDPTFTSAGTILFQTDIGATGNPTTIVGGEFAARQEWILASSQTYLLRYTSATANAKVTLVFEWYEES